MLKSPVMKSGFFLAIGLLAPVFLSAQICVTHYDGTQFGLNDVESYINVLEIDSFDNVWFGLRKTGGDGLGMGKYENNEWMEINNPSIVPDPRINDIAFDAFDSVWVATDGGISVFHRLSFQGRIMNTANSNLPFNDVTAITVDRQGRVWAGFGFGHVAAYAGANWQVVKEWPNLMVYDLAAGPDNSLWIALDGVPGIVVFRDTNWIQLPEVRSVRSLTLDPLGRMLAMNRDSVVVFNDLDIKAVIKPDPGTMLLDVAVGPMGGLWASTTDGLLRRKAGTFVRYGAHNSAVPAQISGPIGFNSMGQLWFGYNYNIGASIFSGTGYLYLATDPQPLVVTTDRPGNEFCWGDSITLVTEDGSTSYVWPDGENDNSYTSYTTEVVEVAVERENQCYFYDTVSITMQRVYEEEKVCAVSVDTTGSILVIWEKTADVGTQSFNIYRENDAGAWEFVGNIPMNRLSVFEDWNANPAMRSQRYKISCVDTCGNESGQSFYHNTLLLVSTYGDLADEVRLIWNQYDSLEYAEYIISSGPSPEELKEVARVPRDVHTYVLRNVLDTIYFQVSIELPEECAPTADLKAGTGPYSHSLSNLDDNRKLLTHITDPGSVIGVQAYPNPFADRTRIVFPNPARTVYRLAVYNINGKKVREIRKIRDSEVFLERDGLDTGFYLFELKGEKTFRGKFVIR